MLKCENVKIPKRRNFSTYFRHLFFVRSSIARGPNLTQKNVVEIKFYKSADIVKFLGSWDKNRVMKL